MSVSPTSFNAPTSNTLEGLPPPGTKLGDYKVSIASLDKAAVLARLFNNACKTYEKTVSAELTTPTRTMSLEEAKKHIKDGEFDIDCFLEGRYIDAYTKGHVLYTKWYNCEYGENSAENVVASFLSSSPGT